MDFEWFGIQMVGLCTMSNVQDMTIQKLDQYIGKQDAVHWSSIQMVGLSSIQMAFEYLNHLNTRLI